MDKLAATALEYISAVDAYIERQAARAASWDTVMAEFDAIKQARAADLARFDDIEAQLRAAVGRVPA